ncbi:methyltransferase, FkbM family [Mucilaginibacter pineti]|uniref:Methyltransferase, FkbM family n=2 Tax=Mucilaginibacter pineti TaxID=1391627 RepID=A0A1G6ZNM0_9SPHI|nr:methyltransferase, FkbM family [Mucilaginibacter pineti]
MKTQMISALSRLLRPVPEMDFEQSLIINRTEIFRQKQIDCILDVGANTGQYAESVLSNYSCRIISFEPMKREFDKLNKKLSKYKQWTAHHIGLGESEEQLSINVSANSFSSSLLNLNAETLGYNQDIGYVGNETVQIKRLDAIWNELNITGNRTLLKIDTQGYEARILNGCRDIVDQLFGIQVELSVVQLYQGEPLFDEMFHKILALGFDLYVIEPGYKDPHTGKLLQLEAVFFRS